MELRSHTTGTTNKKFVNFANLPSLILETQHLLLLLLLLQMPPPSAASYINCRIRILHPASRRNAMMAPALALFVVLLHCVIIVRAV